MKYYKFKWQEEFGWEDWRDLEWTVKASNEEEAWRKFYEEYDVIDNYVDWYVNTHEEEIDKEELAKNVSLDKLEEHLAWMIANERSEYIFNDIEVIELGK
jgi:hypothetical protein